jgi:putative transposase
MPWSQTSPMDQRTQFIADFLRATLSISELCSSYGVSRKTGYKWIDRYLQHGPEALVERSRRPQNSPNGTPREIVASIIEARRHHPSWGAKKLLTILHKKHPRWPWPKRSTVCDILKRQGLVASHLRRLTATDASQASASRVSGFLRGPLRQCQRWHPLER